MKFWEKHAEEMRRTRLLAAAATLYAPMQGDPKNAEGKRSLAVQRALWLEEIIEEQLNTQDENIKLTMANHYSRVNSEKLSKKEIEAVESMEKFGLFERVMAGVEKSNFKSHVFGKCQVFKPGYDSFRVCVRCGLSDVYVQNGHLKEPCSGKLDLKT
jgi:hypothetical protein